jgi:hypothetical protein
VATATQLERLKMKNAKFAWVALLAALAAGTASAQSMVHDSGYYGEIGYTPLSIDGKGVKYKPDVVRFVFGKDLNSNLSIEGMYLTTVSKDTYNGTTASYSGYGLYLKPKMELTNDTEVFARVGYARSESKESGAGFSSSGSGSDLSYGIGIQTKFTKEVYGQLDYINYYDKDSVKIKGFTVSMGTRF